MRGLLGRTATTSIANQQWLDYSGLTQETARGWTYRERIHPDDLDSFVQQWNEFRYRSRG